MSSKMAYAELVGNNIKPESWDDVHKKLVAANFVSCVDNYKPEQIIDDLKNAYTGTHTAQQIADAILACCKHRDKKISKEYFLLFVITKLGEKKAVLF